MLAQRIDQGKVAILEVNHPRRGNSLGSELGLELSRLIQEFKSDWQKDPIAHRLLAISAKPIERPDKPPVWISGGDLKELSKLHSAHEGSRYAEIYRELCKDIEHLEVPVISLIDGLAIGGAIELCLASDFRWASKQSLFLFKQLNMGLNTGYGGCRRLIECVGKSKASQYLLLTATVDADQALKDGLIHEVFLDGPAMMQRLSEIAERIDTIDPEVLHLQKQTLRYSMEHLRDEALQQESKSFEKLWMQDAHKKALEAFQKK